QGGRALYVVSLESSWVRPITTGTFADIEPHWSPDSRQVAFTRLTLTRGKVSPRAELCVVDGSGGPVHVLAHVDVEPNARAAHIGWGPDGRWIGFMTRAGGGSEVERVDVSTGAITDLSRSDSINIPLSWPQPQHTG